MPAARNTSLKLLPDIASKVRPRAAMLNLPVSTYVGILIWNQYLSPLRLEALPDSAKLARVNMPCSFRTAVAPLLVRIARDAGLSENATAEALIARDQQNPHSPLTILPAKTKRTP